MTLTRVKTGDAIRAGDHNGIVDWLLRRIKVRTGPGLAARWGEDGLMLTLVGAGMERHLLPGIVLARSGVDGSGIGLASAVKYTAGALGKFREVSAGVYTGMVVEDQLPAYGRIFKGTEASTAKVRAAEVGSFCTIVRRHDGEGGTEGEIWIPLGGTRGETPLGEVCEGG